MKNFLNTIKRKTFSFWLYLFKGLHQADRVAFGTKEEGLNSGTIAEEKDEQQSVWADLLNHRMTQAVKDLRYETAHAVRESMKYQHDGAGHGKKLNKIFEFKGNVENSENYKIAIVQDNIEDIATVNDVLIDQRNEKKYFFDFKRDFTSCYRLECYVNRVVVKEINKDEKKYQIDLYVPDFREEENKNVYSKELYDLLLDNKDIKFEDRDNFFQTNRTSKLFYSELQRVFNGDRRSEIVDFYEFSFQTFRNTYGSYDGITYIYDNIQYKETIKYDGSFVLKFECTLKDKIDSIAEVYDEVAERKFKNKEKRDNVKIDFNTEAAKMQKEVSDDEFYNEYCKILGEDKKN